MHSEWKTFLQARGALVAEDCVQHFGAPQAELEAATSGNILADLSHLDLIEARGADAFGFLQGQLSNDLRAASETRAQLSAWCSAQGRVLALMMVLKRDDAYYLQLPREILESTLKRLRMFVLRAQVTLTDVSDALPQIGLSGTQAADLLNSQFGRAAARVPDAPYAVVQREQISIVRLPGRTPRFVLIGPYSAIRAVWEKFSSALTPTGGAPWKLLDIRDGLPALHPNTQSQFIPQMLNLDALDAVSFTKGCYPGQEIVARARHLGEVKRRLYLASAQSETAPQPGDVLYARAGAETVGQVINAQASSAGGFDLLAVVQTGQARPDNVHLAGPDGPLLHFSAVEKDSG